MVCLTVRKILSILYVCIYLCSYAFLWTQEPHEITSGSVGYVNVYACVFLTGLGHLSLNVLCVLILDQLLLLQLATRAQNLPQGFLATESDTTTEIHMSLGYRQY